MLIANVSTERDTYFDLINEFPLRRLRNRSQHAQAVKTLAKASLAHQRTHDSSALDYLDILAGLIDRYERDARLKANISGRTPAEVIRHLMAAKSLSISSLAREMGIGQSNLSEMLSGHRDFSKSAIKRLCRRFALSSELFFGKN